MAVTPASNGDAQVALCLVKESDTLGSAMWTLLDFVAVKVCQSTPLQEDPVQRSKEDPGQLKRRGNGWKEGTFQKTIQKENQLV